VNLISPFFAVPPLPQAFASLGQIFIELWCVSLRPVITEIHAKTYGLADWL